MFKLILVSLRMMRELRTFMFEADLDKKNKRGLALKECVDALKESNPLGLAQALTKLDHLNSKRPT